MAYFVNCGFARPRRIMRGGLCALPYRERKTPVRISAALLCLCVGILYGVAPQTAAAHIATCPAPPSLKSYKSVVWIGAYDKAGDASVWHATAFAITPFFLVTNAHVAEGLKRAAEARGSTASITGWIPAVVITYDAYRTSNGSAVHTPDRYFTEVRIALNDTPHDIAVLEVKVPLFDIEPVTFAPHGPATAEAGFAIGHPENSAFAVVDLSFIAPYNPAENSTIIYITNASGIPTPFGQGSSGSPLFNCRGEVVGINTHVFSTNPMGQGTHHFALSSAVHYWREKVGR